MNMIVSKLQYYDQRDKKEKINERVANVLFRYLATFQNSCKEGQAICHFVRRQGTPVS